MEAIIGDDEGVKVFVSGDCLQVRTFGNSDEIGGLLTTNEARTLADAINFICDRMEGYADGH